jgi:hypothetical protein
LLGCILSLNIFLGFDLKKAGEEFGETRLFEECYIEDALLTYLI